MVLLAAHAVPDSNRGERESETSATRDQLSLFKEREACANDGISGAILPGFSSLEVLASSISLCSAFECALWEEV